MTTTTTKEHSLTWATKGTAVKQFKLVNMKSKMTITTEHSLK
jgi:hypothetical protein